MKKNQKMIITVVLVVLIVLVGFTLFNGKDSSSEKDTDDTAQVIDNNTTASSSIKEQGAEGLSVTGIKVEEQNPGRIVVVNQVLIDAPGWVVIREDANGRPGNILGARLFGKGSNSGVIQLLNSMKVGKSYFAVVHKDNGNEAFELAKDTILKDANGTEVMTKFAVTQGSDAPIQ